MLSIHAQPSLSHSNLYLNLRDLSPAVRVTMTHTEEIKSAPNILEPNYRYSDQLKTSLPDARPVVATIWHSQGGGGLTANVGAVELKFMDGSVLSVEGDVPPELVCAPETDCPLEALVPVKGDVPPTPEDGVARMSCVVLDDLVALLETRATEVRYDPHGWEALGVTAPWESPDGDDEITP